jgi:hypothetical protein
VSALLGDILGRETPTQRSLSSHDSSIIKSASLPVERNPSRRTARAPDSSEVISTVDELTIALRKNREQEGALEVEEINDLADSSGGVTHPCTLDCSPCNEDCRGINPFLRRRCDTDG